MELLECIAEKSMWTCDLLPSYFGKSLTQRHAENLAHYHFDVPVRTASRTALSSPKDSYIVIECGTEDFSFLFFHQEWDYAPHLLLPTLSSPDSFDTNSDMPLLTLLIN